MTPRTTDEQNGVSRRRTKTETKRKPKREQRERNDDSLYRSTGRGGPAESERLKVERLAARVAQRLAKCRAYSFPNPRIMMEYETAHRALTNVSRELQTIPPGWKPPSGTLGQPPIVEGTKVTFREAVRRQYEGLVDDVKRALIARKIKGNRMFVEGLVDDEPVLIPVRLSHVRRAPLQEAK